MTEDSGTPLEIRTELREKLAQYFNKEELRTLCFDLGIQYEDLPDTLEGMARDLVAFLDRRGRIPDLIARCRTLRPNLTYDQAIVVLKKARLDYPKNQELERLYIEVVYSQGVSWHEAGNLPKAESAFAEVLKLDPQYKNAAQVAQRLDDVRQRLLLQRAQALYDAKDYDRAIVVLKKARLAYPKNQEIERQCIEVVYCQGVSWHEVGNLPKAESAFAEVLKLAPQYKDAAQRLDDVRQRLLLQQAQTLYDAKDYDRAIVVLKKGRSAYPKNQELERLYIEVVYCQGVSWHEVGNLPKAESAFAEVLKLAPRYKNAAQLLDEVRQQLLLQRAQALYDAKDYDQAIVLLEKARSDYPKNQEIERLYIEVVYSQGVSMYEAGNLALAESAFATVLELDPRYKNAAQLLDEVRQRLLLQQAQELYNEKRYDQAIVLLEKARSDYPKNQEIERLYIEVVYSQGVSMYEAGNLALAESAFATVLELDPRYKNAAQLLDEVRQRLLLQQAQELYNEKRYDQAIVLLEKARSDYPKNQEIERMHIEVVCEQAQALYNEQHYDQAIALLKKAHSDYPKNQIIKRQLRRDTLLRFLRDPKWQGIGVVVAILALALTVSGLLPPCPDPKSTVTKPILPLSPSPTPAVTSSAAAALRAWHGEYAAVTDSTAARRLKAIAAQVDESSRFTLLCLTNDKVALQFLDRFVSALNNEGDRNWELRAVAPERLEWEEFTLADPDTRDPLHCVEVLKQLQQGEVRLAFQTSHGKFVTAFGQDQDWVLRAETTVLDRYEKFAVINLALTPTVTLTPTLSPTPTAVVVDTMDSLAGWTKSADRRFITDTTGSAINISSVPGWLDNAIRIDYNLKQGGWVLISKEITPALPSGTHSMRFRYKGTGPADTIELKLRYKPDPNYEGEVFSYSQPEIVGTDDWVTFEQLYSAFACGDTCTTPGQKLDLGRVWTMDIAVSHQQGGAPGPGSVLVDQVEAIGSSSPTPTPTPTCPTHQDYHCQEVGAFVTETPGPSDEYCTETVALPEPTLAHTISIFMTKRKLEDLGYSLYEVEAYGRDNPEKNLLAPYLFSIEAGPTVLVEGAVSSYLREQFRRQSTLLSPEARLRFDPTGQRWAIVDNDRIYAIDSKNGKLDVSGGAQAHASGGAQALVSIEDDGRIAPYAIDGSLVTRWASAKCCKFGGCLKDDYGNVKCDNLEGQNPQLLEITLPRQALVDRIVLKWEKAYALEYCVTVKPAPQRLPGQ